DQLANEVGLERRVLRRGLELLETVGQRKGCGVEDSELLLDRDGEVIRRFELLARERDLLLGTEALRIAHPTTLIEGLQQPFGDAAPAPALHGGFAGRFSETRAVVEFEQSAELLREVSDIAACEARQVAVLGRILGLEALGDLLQTGVARDERRAAGCGSLRCDHPERLREDRRHDRDVSEREQVSEVAMLQRTGEERARRGGGLELRSVVPEADDHRASVEVAERLEQQVNTLVVEQLPEV